MELNDKIEIEIDQDVERKDLTDDFDLSGPLSELYDDKLVEEYLSETVKTEETETITDEAK